MIEWYYLVLISAALMGFSSVLEKYMLKDEHASAYSASFSIIIALMALVFVPFADFNISLYAVALVFLISVVSTVSYILTARVYKHGNISVSSPILSSLPQLLIVVFAFMFLSERLSFVQYMSIAVMIIAAYLLLFKANSRKRTAFDGKRYIYELVMVVALMAIGGVLLKYLLFYMTPYTYIVLVEAFIALDMTVYMQLRYGGVKEIAHNMRKHWMPLLAIAVIAMAYRITYYLAVSTTYVSLTSPLRNTLSVVITVLAGGLLFKEGNIARKLALAAVMVTAVYFLIA
ncbi:MAG: DMT family transporter [Candidatus Marsarchaeota archaeon]|nr:DMT family transporter [Candidatus Marsarchaeota archaeon]